MTRKCLQSLAAQIASCPVLKMPLKGVGLFSILLSTQKNNLEKNIQFLYPTAGGISVSLARHFTRTTSINPHVIFTIRKKILSLVYRQVNKGPQLSLAKLRFKFRFLWGFLLGYRSKDARGHVDLLRSKIPRLGTTQVTKR